MITFEKWISQKNYPKTEKNIISALKDLDANWYIHVGRNEIAMISFFLWKFDEKNLFLGREDLNIIKFLNKFILFVREYTLIIKQVSAHIILNMDNFIIRLNQELLVSLIKINPGKETFLYEKLFPKGRFTYPSTITNNMVQLLKIGIERSNNFKTINTGLHSRSICRKILDFESYIGFRHFISHSESNIFYLGEYERLVKESKIDNLFILEKAQWDNVKKSNEFIKKSGFFDHETRLIYTDLLIKQNEYFKHDRMKLIKTNNFLFEKITKIFVNYCEDILRYDDE